MRDTILFRAFTDPSGGWGSVVHGFLLLCLVAFLAWVSQSRRTNK
jgi:hypothetical protein